MIVDRVNSSFVLAHRILQQSLSIILFVTLWSYDSFQVHDTLEQLSQELNCSTVKFFEFDVSIFDLPRSRPRHPLKTLLWLRPKESNPHHVAYNITTDLPWFPAIRVVKTEAGRIRHTRTYRGSFSPSSLRNFLAQYCHHSRKSTPRSPYVVLPGQIFDLVHSRSPTAAKGVLLFADDHANHIRSILEAAIAQIESCSIDSSIQCKNNQGNGRQRKWLLAVFIKSEYAALAERFNIAPAAPGCSIVLLDAYLDKVEVLSCAKVSTIYEAALELTYFDKTVNAIWNVPPRATEEKGIFQVASSAPEWLWQCATMGHLVPITCTYNEKLCSRRNLTLTSSFAELRQNTTLWVVFFEPWCAFCQRVMPAILSFADRAAQEGLDARVFSMTKFSSLPAAIDHFVDGFPTVLLVRGRDRLMQVKEYTGSYEVDDLLSHARNTG